MFVRVGLGEQALISLKKEAEDLFLSTTENQHDDVIFENKEMHATQALGVTTAQDTWLSELCQYVALPHFQTSLTPELVDYWIDFSRLLPIQERFNFFSAFGVDWLHKEIVDARFDKCIQVLLREHRPHFLDLYPVAIMQQNFNTMTGIIFTLIKLNTEDKEPFLRKLGIHFLKEKVNDNKAMSLFLNYLPVEIRSDFFREMLYGDKAYKNKIIPTKQDRDLLLDKCMVNQFAMFHSMATLPAVKSENLRSSLRK